MPYGWHTSTYEYIRVTYEWHTSDLPMTYEYIQIIYEYIQVTYERHTSDLQVHTIGIRNITPYKVFEAFRS